MRLILSTAAAAALAAAGLFSAQPAQAIEYPWCAIYSGNSGVQNCGFVSFQQCMATISGAGGFCQQNPRYVAPTPPPPPPRR
jgi:hypothetical protein